MHVRVKDLSRVQPLSSLITYILSQLNYYSMETVFAAENQVFSKSFFAASNVVGFVCLYTYIYSDISLVGVALVSL